MSFSGPPLNHSVILTELLKYGLDSFPDELALISRETRWTWRELERDSNRYAANLLGLGLKKGDRVASLMPNRNALIVHYLGCIKSGMITTPFNYRYMAPEIDYALSLSGASLMLAHEERAADLADCERVKQLALGVSWYGKPKPGAGDFETLLEHEPANTSLPSIEPSDPVFIYFTSGSTGKPKGVVHTHATMGNMVAALVEAMKLDHRDRFLPGSSISHIGGSLNSLSGLASGAQLITARNFDGDEILSLMHEYRPTVLVMLPAALFALVRDHNARPDDFHSLRFCMSGGDKVSLQLEEEFSRLSGFYIEEGYGMSEIGMCTMNPVDSQNKLGSVGVLAAGFEAEIRDERGNPVPADTIGRMWVRSPANTIGYWERSDATRETIVDGWLDTGDMMKVDPDQYFWFAGRKKQIIVHDGSNICPQEVEESLLANPKIDQAAVIGVHDLVHGDNVRAYVTLVSDTQATSQELIQFSRRQVGYKAPEEVVFLDEMPMNATGKVDRNRLKQIANRIA